MQGSSGDDEKGIAMLPLTDLSVACSGSNNWGEVPENLLLPGEATQYAPFYTSKWSVEGTTAWIEVKVTTGPVRLARYGLRSGNDNPGRDPSTWTVSGIDSASGSATLLHTVDGSSSSSAVFPDRWQWREYDVSSGDARAASAFTSASASASSASPATAPLFDTFRIDIAANAGAAMIQLAQVKLYAEISPWRSELASADHIGFGLVSGTKFALKDLGRGEYLQLGPAKDALVMWDNGSAIRKFTEHGLALERAHGHATPGTQVVLWQGSHPGHTPQRWRHNAADGTVAAIIDGDVSAGGSDEGDAGAASASSTDMVLGWGPRMEGGKACEPALIIVPYGSANQLVLKR